MDEGLPFLLDNLWQRSSFGLLPEKDSLIETPEFDLPELNITDNYQALLSDPVLDFSLLDERGDAEGNQLDDLELPPQANDIGALSTDHGIPLAQFDIWSAESSCIDNSKLPRLQTWEAFEKREVANSTRTACLSEAGPHTLDAALAMPRRQQSSGVLPRDVSLHALCNLALGRSSVFFQWEEAKQSFERTLKGTPTAGFSLDCSDSLTCDLMDYATMHRRLQAYELATSSHRSPAAVVAFKRSIASVLEAVEANISFQQMDRTWSLLQLQATMEGPRQLLQLLDSLREGLNENMTDEVVISRLSDMINVSLDGGSGFASTLRAILAQVSRPWLAALTADLSLTHQPAMSARTGTQSAADTSVLDASISSLETIRTDGDTFLTKEDRELLKETRDTVKILRTYLPQCADDACCLSESELPDVLRNENPSATGSDVEQTAWGAHDVQLHYLESIDGLMSTEPNLLSFASNDPVYTAANASLAQPDRSEEGSAHHASLEYTSEVNPFGTIRPTIEAQARRSNRILLRYLFDERGLRHHLELQRAFHLFGNGDFVSRLSTALFSTETQSAERKRGIVPTGETMGLRLGAREGQRWPPASSELRLSLLGVLHEAYHGEPPSGSNASSGKSDLPGGLSFAIRELPDSEIDRVMDVDSIYALDFMRLQYAASPPLDAILTPVSMQKYDDIFRFLLRILRVLDLTTQLQKDYTYSHRSHNKEVPRFTREAHTTVSALLSYFMDAGIAVPWTQFQRSLNNIEKALSASTLR